MDPLEHRRWMEEHNPEGWTNAQWEAFTTLMNQGGAYAERAREVRSQRHKWAEAQTIAEIGTRSISPQIRRRIRLEYNCEARTRFPHADPIEAYNALSRYSATPRQGE